MGGTWAFARQAAPRGTGAPEPTAELLRWGTPQQNSWESLLLHRSLNVPIEHHPTIRYMVYNGYYKVMSNIPKMGQLPTPVLSPRIDWIDDSVVSSMIKGDHCRFRLCFLSFWWLLGLKSLEQGPFGLLRMFKMKEHLLQRNTWHRWWLRGCGDVDVTTSALPCDNLSIQKPSKAWY